MYEFLGYGDDSGGIRPKDQCLGTGPATCRDSRYSGTPPRRLWKISLTYSGSDLCMFCSAIHTCRVDTVLYKYMSEENLQTTDGMRLLNE